MFLAHPAKSAKAILKWYEDRIKELSTRLEYIQEALGRIESRQLDSRQTQVLADKEFRVFSQWGEDGIIQYLVRRLEIENKTFVEFGVEGYVESNTRFLLVNNNWSGLILDGSIDNINQIKQSRIYWAYNLKAAHSFITRDNINEVLTENGVKGEIGLLSIDIDGNDFWVWQAINVINPVIVVVEYNYRFGKEAAVTIPYQESFDRNASGQSPIYFGASLKALCWLAERKGYDFVGCNSNAVNAFFVRKDKRDIKISKLTAEEGYVEGGLSEEFSEGVPLKRTLEEERQLIMKLPLVNVEELN